MFTLCFRLVLGGEYAKNIALLSLQILYILLLRTRNWVWQHFLDRDTYQFAVRNTKIYKTRKLYRVISCTFYNISPSNFATNFGMLFNAVAMNFTTLLYMQSVHSVWKSENALWNLLIQDNLCFENQQPAPKKDIHSISIIAFAIWRNYTYITI